MAGGRTKETLEHEAILSLKISECILEYLYSTCIDNTLLTIESFSEDFESRGQTRTVYVDSFGTIAILASSLSTCRSTTQLLQTFDEKLNAHLALMKNRTLSLSLSHSLKSYADSAVFQLDGMAVSRHFVQQ